MSTDKRNKKSSSVYSGKRAGYNRDKDLPRLTGLWPGEINTDDIKIRERIVATLRNALRLERQRGKAGHWCYDINRHLALKKALAQELIALRKLARIEKGPLRSRPGSHVKNGSRKIAQADRDGTAPKSESSQPVLFLALPTASSS